jgi:hypothetical protein
VSQTALDLIAVAGAAVGVLVDSRLAVGIAALAAAIALAPTAAIFGGGGAALTVLGAGAAAASLGWGALRLGAHLGAREARSQGPRVRAREALFGPRTIRAASAAVAIPASSWVSFNIPVGSVTFVEGRLFPVALVVAFGVVRLLAARNRSDIGCGIALSCLGVSVGWLLRGAGDPLPVASGIAAIASVASVVDAWLKARRPARTARVGA